MSSDIFENLATSSIFTSSEASSELESGSTLLSIGEDVTDFVAPLAKALGGISDLIGLIN